jgi:(p)ppGpp synthase/HD superfamily hydrolase
MTPRFNDALALAATAHVGQQRKGTDIPYIVHPVAVAGLVARFGGDEDQQIAALLHDVIEDGGPGFKLKIAAFGERVLAIVEGCTDGEPNAAGVKPPWPDRKRRYLEHLRHASDDVLLVSGCDKLHNATSILEDLIDVGTAVFDRFSVGMDDTLWYYRELAQTFLQRGVVIAGRLDRTVAEIERLSRESVSDGR